MAIAKRYQVYCPQCNEPGIIKIAFYERCFCGRCQCCQTIFMFSRKNRTCMRCDRHTECLLRYPIIVGDNLRYEKEKAKTEEDQESFNWRIYTIDASKLDCV